MATSAQIRQQLVEALLLDLIGPTPEHRERLEERLPQPPSIWYTTGFLVPNAFQEEAGRPAEGDQPSSADLAGEDSSNDAAIRQERGEDDDDANDSPRDTTSKRNWFTPSADFTRSPRNDMLAPLLTLSAARSAEVVAQGLQSKGAKAGKDRTGEGGIDSRGARRQAPRAASQSLTARQD